MEVLIFTLLRIGSAKRLPLAYLNANPGPGTYKSVTKIGEGPKYPLSSMHSPSKGDLVPGPGQYDPKVEPIKKKAPKFPIGTEPKSRYSKQLSPGPGNYNIQSSLGGPKFV